MNSGIINVLKPAGMTSNQVLTKIKKMLNPQKIGHLGTLDPSAVGVLPICINKATKLFDLYLKKDKEYRAVFVFGKETDTLDSDGKIINQNDVKITVADIENIIPKVIGKHKQMPPKYSAKNVNGKRAYQLARENVEFELKPKEVEIYDIKLISQTKENTFLFDIKCSSGTYIRSIVRDMAYMLGTFGYMAGLIRTKSGNFCVEDSIKIDDMTEKSILPLDKVLSNREKVFVNDKFYDKLSNGNTVFVDSKDLTDCVVYCKNELFGIADIKKSLLKLKVNLREKND